MELRHLRYFIAVAEEGSLTLAAERRLHTAQPSLSRQIRDLERELGVELLTRGPRGVELTAAGRAFLDHARIVLLQVEAAREAARRAAAPPRSSFAIGFLTGHELAWLPAVMAVLRDALPQTEVVIHSQLSPELAAGLIGGKLDLAFLRREQPAPGLAYRRVAQEPLIVVLPVDHPLAAETTIRPQDVAGATVVGVPLATAPILRGVIDAYAKQVDIDLTPDHHADNLSMTFSLVASTSGLALLPRYAQTLLPPFVVSRPLRGEPPTIDLVIGYNQANTSPLLKVFLSKVDELIRLAPRPGA